MFPSFANTAVESLALGIALPVLVPSILAVVFVRLWPKRQGFLLAGLAFLGYGLIYPSDANGQQPWQAHQIFPWALAVGLITAWIPPAFGKKWLVRTCLLIVFVFAILAPVAVLRPPLTRVMLAAGVVLLGILLWHSEDCLSDLESSFARWPSFSLAGLGLASIFYSGIQIGQFMLLLGLFGLFVPYKDGGSSLVGAQSLLLARYGALLSMGVYTPQPTFWLPVILLIQLMPAGLVRYSRLTGQTVDQWRGPLAGAVLAATLAIVGHALYEFTDAGY